jgi:hypothetical protein
MYKQQFDKLSELRSKLNDMEDDFKSLGHELIGSKAFTQVNRTLSKFIALRDGLWDVDKALEIEMEKNK